MAIFKIKNRFSGAVLYSGDHETLRDAVFSAIKGRADLSGAYLSGANLSGANLSRANLSGADLSGADLSRAVIGAFTIASKAAQVRRDDGYEFFGFSLQDGGLLIRAGCQTRLIDDYRQHVADDYPGTAKAIETLAILDFVQARHDATKGDI